MNALGNKAIKMISKKTIRRVANRLFCRHLTETKLIFGPNPYTHNDIETCLKCGKSKIIFRGNQFEWRKHHKI